MSCKGILVLADATSLDVEARETEHLLLEDREVLVAELADEQLLRETAVARVLIAILDVSHALIELLTRDV